jgi:serine/threonine-protein kinase RsbW
MMKADSDLQMLYGTDDLPQCREAAEKAAASAGFTGQDLGDVVCAIFEACANAVTHGRGSQNRPATLCVRVYDDRLEAVVRDSGDKLSQPPGAGLPSPRQARGRGIPLMKLFMDEVRLETKDGLEVTLVKYRPVSS